jgi:hypothetical protein
VIPTALPARPTFHAGTDSYAGGRGAQRSTFTPRALEELVGEIYDEFDRDVASAHHEPDGP